MAGMVWPLPGGPPASDGGRDPRLELFASGGKLDGAFPAGHVLVTLESLATPRGAGAVPFAGSTHDEDAGMLAAAAAAESHAAAVKLAAVRQIIRRHAPSVPGGGLPDPGTWDEGLSHEVAAILRIPWQTAAVAIDLAWQLEARLPSVGDLLNRGVLSYYSAKIIADEFSVLDDEKVREAERMLLGQDLGADDMTPGAIRRRCQHIAVTVDPDAAENRRKAKERNARLDFFKEPGGSMGLYGTGLPAEQALLSDANIRARVQAYKDAGIKESTDFLRAQAGLDLTNGVSVEDRHAAWITAQPGAGGTGGASPDGGDSPDGKDRGDDGSSGGTGGGDPRGNGPGGPAVARTSDPALPAIVNLTAPLATILGEANRPGEAPGFGALDPALTRQLVEAAVRSARSRFCLTFTNEEGHAVAHGCAKLIHAKPTRAKPIPTMPTRGKPTRAKPAGTEATATTFARATASATATGPPGPPGGARDGPDISGNGWAFTRDTSRRGPEGGYGAWILELPSGRRYRVDVHKIPLHDCDHTYATTAYRPTALLRHLVEIRDGECTFVACSHPARQSDFEHAIPYDQGGKTDACNGGMRSRRCHRVKQSKGWRVTQPMPGWHRWTAPSGRCYTKRPKRYPA